MMRMDGRDATSDNGRSQANLTELLTVDDYKNALLPIVRSKGYERHTQPLTLASGEESFDFIDGKRALAQGRDLRCACEAILAIAADAGIDFDAVGGLTLGADQFAHGVALIGDKQWFTIRKERKGRGTNKLVEGSNIGEGTRVLLVDDIVTTGGSIQQAYENVTEVGAVVVLAVTLVDRGEIARVYFEAKGVPYRPLLTYQDLEIEPVGRGGSGRLASAG